MIFCLRVVISSLSSEIDGPAPPELPSPIDIHLPRGKGSESCWAINLASLKEATSCIGCGGEEPPGAEELPTSNEDLTLLGPFRVGWVGVAALEGCWTGGACSWIRSPCLWSSHLVFTRGWEVCVSIWSLIKWQWSWNSKWKGRNPWSCIHIGWKVSAIWSKVGDVTLRTPLTPSVNDQATNNRNRIRRWKEIELAHVYIRKTSGTTRWNTL